MSSFPILTLTIIITIILSFSTNPTFSTGAGNLLSPDKDSVQLTRQDHSTSDIIVHNPPFNFTSKTSFHSNFTFQIDNGGGVALVIIPANITTKIEKDLSFTLLDENRFLGIEFGVDSCRVSSSRVGVSKILKNEMDHVLKEGVKLTSWVDYRAVLKRLDVRVGEFGESKPVEALVSYRVDLGGGLKGEEVLFGLVSGDGNNGKVAYVYSWSFEIKDVPKWVHSMPVNPDEQRLSVHGSKVKRCFLSGFMFAAGCGALAALVLFFVWVYVVDRPKVEGEGSVCPGDFKYEKIGVVKANGSDTVVKV